MKTSQVIFKAIFSGGSVMIFATLLAAIGWMASKEVISEVSPTLFIGARFLLAACLLLPWCWQGIVGLPRRLLWQALALGVLMNIAMQVWIIALSKTNSMGEGAFITSTAVLLAPLLGWGLFGARPNRSFWLALPLAVLGVAFLSLTNVSLTNGLTNGWQTETAQLYFLAAAVLISLHFNLNKHLTGKMNTLSLVTLQLFGSGCFSFILALLQTHPPLQISAATVGWFAVSVILSTSIRYVMQTLGQYRCSLATAAIIMVLEPVWVLVLGVSFYDEPLSLQKLFGAGLILAALLSYGLFNAQTHIKPVK